MSNYFERINALIDLDRRWRSKDKLVLSYAAMGVATFIAVAFLLKSLGPVAYLIAGLVALLTYCSGRLAVLALVTSFTLALLPAKADSISSTLLIGYFSVSILLVLFMYSRFHLGWWAFLVAVTPLSVVNGYGVAPFLIAMLLYRDQALNLITLLAQTVLLMVFWTRATGELASAAPAMSLTLGPNLIEQITPHFNAFQWSHVQAILTTHWPFVTFLLLLMIVSVWVVRQSFSALPIGTGFKNLVAILGVSTLCSVALLVGSFASLPAGALSISNIALSALISALFTLLVTAPPHLVKPKDVFAPPKEQTVDDMPGHSDVKTHIKRTLLPYTISSKRGSQVKGLLLVSEDPRMDLSIFPRAIAASTERRFVPIPDKLTDPTEITNMVIDCAPCVAYFQDIERWGTKRHFGDGLFFPGAMAKFRYGDEVVFVGTTRQVQAVPGEIMQHFEDVPVDVLGYEERLAVIRKRLGFLNDGEVAKLAKRTEGTHLSKLLSMVENVQQAFNQGQSDLLCDIVEQSASPITGHMPEKQDDIYRYQPLWGSWTIDRLVGRGAFGSVYKVWREDVSDRYVAAVKIISIPTHEHLMEAEASFRGDERSLSGYYSDVVQNIVNEIKVLYTLSGNTNIVNYQDHQVHQRTDGVGWDILIRMEHLTPLKEYVASHEMGEREIIQLGLDICSALEVCARKGIVHRDIKDDNVFVNKDGVYKLGDFGIAREMSKSGSAMSRKGTPLYMAPEIYRGETYGPTVDVYSLGIILYKLLNHGRMPFMPPYPAELRQKHIEEAFGLRISGKSMPAPAMGGSELAKVLQRACAFRPDDRYQSASEMKSALLQVAEGIGAGSLDQVTVEVPSNIDSTQALGVTGQVTPSPQSVSSETCRLISNLTKSVDKEPGFTS